jgi:hypothetical protein
MFSSPHTTAFDWPRAIARNSEALKGIVAALFAMLGLGREVTMARLPHAVHRAVLRVLRPAESAVRRLVVIAARGLVVKPVASRPMSARPVRGGGGGTPRPVFRLFDPRKRLLLSSELARQRNLPRIHVFGADPRVIALWAALPKTITNTSHDDGLINGQHLVRRLHALKSALENLPRQAQRMARWRLRQKKYKSPLRPGRPPGHRKKRTHEIDEILAECHALARDALREDTS